MVAHSTASVEHRRKAWLDDKQPNAAVEAHDAHAMFSGKFGKTAEVDQPKSAAKVGFSKIHNFNRPWLKPDVDQLLTPWSAAVRKGDMQQNVHEAFCGRSVVKGPTKDSTSKDSLSKVEAQVALQLQITSGTKIDWNEVRNLRKIIADAD